MMSRLMFNLRQEAAFSRNNYETTLIPVSGVQFRRKQRREASTTTASDETVITTMQYDLQSGVPFGSEGPSRVWQQDDVGPITLPTILEAPRTEKACNTIHSLASQ